MEGHGIRMMPLPKVFGGMIKIMIGCLVVPLGKEVQKDLLILITMKDVFQKYQIKNGNYMILIGMMLKTKSKSDVAINQKVNMY